MEPTRKQRDGHEQQVLLESTAPGTEEGDELLYLPSSDLTMGVTVSWPVSFYAKGWRLNSEPLSTSFLTTGEVRKDSA